MVELAAELETAITKAVAGQREAGFSWADIGAPLGMSKQGAQQRWGRKVAQLTEGEQQQ